MLQNEVDINERMRGVQKGKKLYKDRKKNTNLKIY